MKDTQQPASAGSRSCRHRSDFLLPREHGVYAEVGFPLLTVLGLGSLTTSGALLATSVVAAFLLHEPVIVLLGRRGRRTKARLEWRAKVQAVVLGAAAFTCGVTGLSMASVATGLSVLALMPVLVGIGVLVTLKREKTLFGESLIALTLSYASVPVGLSCGVPILVALVSATIWATVFLLGTTTVHAILARSKQGTVVPALRVSTLALLLVVGATATVVLGGPWWVFATVPPSLVSVGVIALNLTPKRLRVVGWALVLANVVTMAILVSAFAGHGT